MLFRSISAQGGCSAYNPTISVTITAQPSASISYAATPYCSSTSGSVSPTITGTTGGVFSSTTGLSIISSTGAVTPSTSTAGTYTVTYILAATAGCAPDTSTTSITITPTPTNTTISYAASSFCRSVTTSQAVTINGRTGGVFSATAGLTIDAGTGAITPSTSGSAVAGSQNNYTVTYTIEIGRAHV